MSKKLTEQEVWEMVKRKLDEQGISFENLLETLANVDDAEIAVICATQEDLGVSIEELTESNRNQVVMVRVDEDTDKTLSMWMETGAVKSKSEAAALFIKEGLKLRSGELDELTDAIEEVKTAKARLQVRAQKIFGEDGKS
ncbi:MAG: GTP-sensing pleiotropic transcriptional regulator CodY [Candidatus Krumholzibacteriia bacterium]|jgi:GTP-sensing pleiotropic transcriptional regulator CodY